MLVQAACELADAYQHYYAYSEGHGKSYEGAVSLVVDPAAYLGAPRQPDQPGHSVIGQIHLASYVFARHGRSEDFASVDELAAFARQTHQAELAESYCYDGED